MHINCTLTFFFSGKPQEFNWIHQTFLPHFFSFFEIIQANKIITSQITTVAKHYNSNKWPPTCSETILSTHRSIDGEIPKTPCNNEEKQQIPSSLAQSMNHPTKWWIRLLDKTNPLSQDADSPDQQHSLSASSSHAACTSSLRVHATLKFKFHLRAQSFR